MKVVYDQRHLELYVLVEKGEKVTPQRVEKVFRWAVDFGPARVGPYFSSYMSLRMPNGRVQEYPDDNLVGVVMLCGGGGQWTTKVRDDYNKAWHRSEAKRNILHIKWEDILLVDEDEDGPSPWSAAVFQQFKCYI